MKRSTPTPATLMFPSNSELDLVRVLVDKPQTAASAAKMLRRSVINTQQTVLRTREKHLIQMVGKGQPGRSGIAAAIYAPTPYTLYLLKVADKYDACVEKIVAKEQATKSKVAAKKAKGRG